MNSLTCSKELRVNGTKRRRYPLGFSFLEILLVLALFTILAALSLPSLPQISSVFNLREAARELASDLQYARMVAISQNQSSQITFISPTYYQVSRVSDGTVLKTRDFATSYPGVMISGAPVTFNSRGMTSSAANMAVSNAHGSKNISVAFSGKVAIQ